MSDETPAASHSVGASHLSLVTLELRGQSRNLLLQLAALPRDRHEAVCSQQLLSDRGDLRGRGLERRSSCLATRRTDDKLHVHQVRCSMLALIDGDGDNSHPANWAPFVVVGEGARYASAPDHHFKGSTDGCAHLTSLLGDAASFITPM